ncbi:MAG TPA: hypothetical protein VGG06_29925 [Thermoanaerobaculia bacterium]
MLAAEKLLDNGGVVGIPKRHFGDSQLRNLIAVANETESPAVVLNFIRYQIGRDSGQRSWGREHGGQSLGDRLIEDLQKGAVEQALARVPGVAEDKTLRQLAAIVLIRQYLGFASRYLKYLDLQRGKEPNRD